MPASNNWQQSHKRLGWARPHPTQAEIMSLVLHFARFENFRLHFPSKVNFRKNALCHKNAFHYSNVWVWMVSRPGSEINVVHCASEMNQTMILTQTLLYFRSQIFAFYRRHSPCRPPSKSGSRLRRCYCDHSVRHLRGQDTERESGDRDIIPGSGQLPR